MVHETPDPGRFFRQVHGILKPSGALLVTEPKFHVGREQFESELQLARQEGLSVGETPAIALCRSALLNRN
jgi:predicted methyltransferase